MPQFFFDIDTKRHISYWFSMLFCHRNQYERIM